MTYPYDLILFDWNGTLCTAEALTESEASVPLFPGVPEMLKTLDEAGVLLAVVTMAARHNIEAQLKAHGIDQYFVALSCGDDGFVKPHPAAIESVLNQTGVHPAKALMVGDSDADISCARYAHTNAVKIGEPLPSDDGNDCIKGVLSIVTELPAWLSQQSQKNA